MFEYDSSGKVGNVYVHGLGIDEPLAIMNGKETYYYHADGLGSIVALTDTSQKVVQTYEYDSFGNLKDLKNAIKQPYTFTAREFDRETGLYYYRARYYDSETGRFTSFDPILHPVNGHGKACLNKFNVPSFSLLINNPKRLNQFVYGEDNPVNAIDPMGLSSITTPTTDDWPPPFPSNWCEAECYLSLLNDYYWCNVAWSSSYLHDPQNAACADQTNAECKKEAYEKYQSCSSNCK